MPHTRSRKTIEVPIKNIIFGEEFVYDSQYQKLVEKSLLKKINVGLTRLHIKNIVSGSYIKTDSGIRYISNLKRKHADIICPAIKRGMRPEIEIYWNPLAPGGGSYVCPDSEVVLAAYAKLRISYIPVRILRPIRSDSRDGSVWVGPKGDYVTLIRSVPPKIAGYEAYANANNVPTTSAFKHLIRRCEFALRSIIRFHVDEPGDIHYHQVLHATVRRHIRLLKSIRSMVVQDRVEHAQILTRVAYEAFLNFYIDWLSPEFFGPRLQLLAMTRQQPTNVDSAESLDALQNFTPFFENVSEKARVSALGVEFYRSVYGPLSRVTHQSYTYVEREAESFGDELDDPQSVDDLMRCINVLTFALIERVLDDVGAL